MNNKKILLILENQIDKIVLAVYVLIGLCLLWVYVVGNPYGEKVPGGRRDSKLSPSEIDLKIKQEADKIGPELERPADPVPPLPPYVQEYDQLVQCSISGISASAPIPLPGAGDVVIEEERLYALPQIPGLEDVTAGNLRGAAQVPTEEITPSHLYTSATGEVKDVDFVSVSARFDVQRLNNNFGQSFMGRQLKTSWKDPALAKPVFASLELQRRTLQNSGQWGPWEIVPRTKIDPYRKKIEELPLTLEQSQFGVNLLMPLYQDKEIQHDILQPDYYSFTISRVEWMPPTFVDEALGILKKEEEKLERERREERLKARSTTDTNRANRRPPTGGTRDRRSPGGMEMLPDMAGGAGLANPRTAVRRERGVEDVKKDFQKELLDEKSDILARTDSLLVWAHDDTAEPGKTYQYRMRIGVFNPIAGKDWFEKDQVQYKDQIVLWSEYSEPTKELSVPKRVYIFPTEVIANANGSNDIEGVKVEVNKYYLGRWRDFEFDAYQGQIIGYEVEVSANKGIQDAMGNFDPAMLGAEADQNAEKVDFTTDITLVDVTGETVWGSKLRPSVLYEMLYCDADGLQQMAIGKGNWSSGTREMYDEIQKSMTSGVQQRGFQTTPGAMPPDMIDPMMMDPMMMLPQ
jgi:hypothetical protein